MKFVFLADYPEALPIVAKWYYEQWGRQHGIDSVKRSEEILSDYFNRNTMPLLILALEKDEILGAIQLKFYEMDIYPNREHWLGGVFVPEKHRGRKIARKLILHAMKIAKSHEVDILFLQTEKLDGGLYKRLGWKPVEKATYRGKEVLIMKKKL
ncbi:MAG: GNAT family N-acetyltransferase [Balneolaceae bacterium]|nr:GNAT family N-acetyltransferase [Balneolaceae bacterium]